jgi:hypothetical protein
MLFTKFLYWFFKNFLALTLPLVVVIWSFGLSIPNATEHSKILRQNNFYPELSSEISRLDKENSFNTKEGLWYLIISSTSPDTATPGSLQNLFESNIDLTSKWFDGQTSNWHFYLPVNTLKTSLNKNFDVKTVQIAKAKQGDIPSCPDSTQIKYIINLEQDFCIPAGVAAGSGLMSDFVKSNLNFQSKLVQVLFSPENAVDKNKTDFKASEVGVVNESLNVAMNNFRDSFLRLKTTVNIILPILLISLLLIPLLAIALNKRPINELKILLRLLGISTLVNTLILIVTSQVVFLQNLNITGLSSEKIVNLMSDTFFKLIVELLSPALYLSFAFIAISLFLYLIERQDLDHFRHFLAKKLTKFDWLLDPKRKSLTKD